MVLFFLESTRSIVSTDCESNLKYFIKALQKRSPESIADQELEVEIEALRIRLSQLTLEDPQEKLEASLQRKEIQSLKEIQSPRGTNKVDTASKKRKFDQIAGYITSAYRAAYSACKRYKTTNQDMHSFQSRVVLSRKRKIGRD